jgi:hypothetical protein
MSATGDRAAHRSGDPEDRSDNEQDDARGGEQWNTDQVSDDEENQSQDNHVIFLYFVVAVVRRDVSTGVSPDGLPMKRFQLLTCFPLDCGVAGREAGGGATGGDPAGGVLRRAAAISLRECRSSRRAALPRRDTRQMPVNSRPSPSIAMAPMAAPYRNSCPALAVMW